MRMVTETESNIISESTRIEGRFECCAMTRFYGSLKGEIHAADGSTLVIGESAVIEGSIEGETIFISGYVRGDVTARTKVVVTHTGRMIGNVTAPKFSIEFGAYFEGRCEMGEHVPKADPSLLPV